MDAKSKLTLVKALSLSSKAGVSVVPVSPDWRNWRERMAGSEATDALAQVKPHTPLTTEK